MIMKRLLSVVVCTLLLIGIFCLPAFAEAADPNDLVLPTI